MGTRSGVTSTATQTPRSPSLGSRPSIAATAVIGFVIDAIRKMVSRCMGADTSSALAPTAMTRLWSPRPMSAAAPRARG
jgi:hypothetical protein